MSGKKANKSIHRYEAALSALAAQVTLQFGVDNIHDFRTTVKKLRALLRWLSTVKKPLTNSFTVLYHLSGELRNVQVLLKDTESEKGLEGFRNWLSVSVTRLEEQWYKIYDRRTIQRLCKKIEWAGYKKGSREMISRFCRKRVNRIRGILFIPSPPDEEMHNARKMLKDMQYVYEWGEKKGLIDDSTALDTIKRIGKQAGNFNDRRISLLLFTAYLEEEKPEGPSLQAAIAIKEKWTASGERQKKELINALDGFVKNDKWEEKL
jgi:CHAD domain-containing protein